MRAFSTFTRTAGAISRVSSSAASTSSLFSSRSVTLRRFTTAAPADKEAVQEVTVESLEALLDTERAATAAAAARTAELSKQVDTLKAALAKAELGTREVQSKVKELQDRVVAEVAEQDAIRERTAKDVASAKKFGISSFCKALLDVADTVDMAIGAGNKQLAANADNEPLRNMLEGITMTQATFAKVLAGQGVAKYESLGQKVDPNLHDVTAQLPDPNQEPGTISFIIKDGYMIQDRVLRPAQVCAVAPRS